MLLYNQLNGDDSNSNASTGRIQNSMDIEVETGSGAFEAALRKIENIQRRLQAIKTYSHSRRTARKHALIQQRKAQIRKLSEHEEEAARAIAASPKYRKDSLKGLVVQVPENTNVQQSVLNPYSPRSATYYVSEVVKTYKEDKSAAREHLSQSLQILKTLENSKMPPKQQIQSKILKLERKPGCENKKTIVFDLDETLIHCNQSVALQHDLKITIRFPTGESSEAGINIRPGAVELLQSLRGKFEVMVFTASQSCYADEILNFLDPEGKLIHHRLYREHCFVSNEGYFVKDLRVLGRPLKDVLLVDNAAYSYAFQLDNGVPILPYFKGKHDYQLRALQNYLHSLVFADDIREHNRRLFQLNRYLEFQGSVEHLVQELYLK